jgi:hypothetical protein
MGKIVQAWERRAVRRTSPLRSLNLSDVHLPRGVGMDVLSRRLRRAPELARDAPDVSLRRSRGSSKPGRSGQTLFGRWRRRVADDATTPPLSRCGARAASNARWDCRGRGECRIPRPCTFVPSQMFSPDYRVSSQNHPAFSIRSLPSRTEPLGRTFLFVACRFSRTDCQERTPLGLPEQPGSSHRTARILADSATWQDVSRSIEGDAPTRSPISAVVRPQ